MTMGRPRKDVEWSQVDKLCGLQCTAEEIAHFLGISPDTLYRRCLEEHQITFADYIDQKRGLGKVSLRRSQWQLAQKGNATMLIWLGKQYLDQRDQRDAPTSANETGQVKLRYRLDDEVKK